MEGGGEVNQDLLEQMLSRIEEVEDSTVVFEEFIFQKLGGFQKKLTDLEKTCRSEVAELQKELSELSDSFNMSSESLPQTESTPATKKQALIGTSLSRLTTGAKTIPEELKDIKDPEVRKLLEPFVPSTMSAREKLTKVQTAYVLYWIDSADDVKGK